MLSVARRGKGSPVALVHGFTQTHESWGTVADGLAARHALMLLDAPGHGGSDATASDPWAAAHQLGETAGRAAYLGYSMGGRLCLHLALRSPDLVTRLVLVSTTAGLESDQERADRRRADEDLARRVEQVGVEQFVDEWLANPLFAGLAPERAGRRERLANTAAGLSHALRHLGTGSQEPLWDRLGTLAMPVLVVAGEHDAKFATLADRLAEAIGDNASAAVIPGAGHACHLEAPESFLAVVSPFLDH
jgi:2-succinyl-6-hydroxy-2,4-cyclohexadiene-1-carboxylate synthase